MYLPIINLNLRYIFLNNGSDEDKKLVELFK